MICCGKCQTPVKREWSCKCHPSLNDRRMEELQPFIAKFNGWANFINLIKTGIAEIENSVPDKIEMVIPDDFDCDLESATKNHILRVLHLHEGNKTHAAAALGISVKTIYNKLEMWGIHIDETMRIEQ